MYSYEDEKKNVFTEDGQVLFLKIRDKTKLLLKQSGAVMLSHIVQGTLGNSWTQLACVDRLVELNEIVEVIQEGVMTQHRVFVKAH